MSEPHPDEIQQTAPEDLPPPEVIERGHEPESATQIKGVVIGGGIVLAAVVGALLVLLLLMRWFEHREPSRAGPVTPFADTMPAPPASWLQSDPAVDLATLRAREEHLLTTYGRAGDGTFRIPIDRAMALLAERGLPVRPGEPVAPDTVRTESGFAIVFPARPPAATGLPATSVGPAPFAPSPRARLLLDTLQSGGLR